jgi:hypothetical protein
MVEIGRTKKKKKCYSFEPKHTDTNHTACFPAGDRDAFAIKPGVTAKALCSPPLFLLI